MASTAPQISERILESVLAQRLAPGARLGEQQLAVLFDCSRTIVREALTRLAARGIVQVSARRGWYVVEPSQQEAREAFDARRVIETGLIRSVRRIDKAAVQRLQAHVTLQKAALAAQDVGTRSFLLGDFHVCLAESLGNRLLADTLRDLTARTSLIATHHQSHHDAAQSLAEHEDIVQALDAGDFARAEHLMESHLTTWQDKLHPPVPADPLDTLRTALALDTAPARADAGSGRPRSRLPATQAPTQARSQASTHEPALRPSSARPLHTSPAPTRGRKRAAPSTSTGAPT